MKTSLTICFFFAALLLAGEVLAQGPLTVVAKGTGQTTGHIATLTVTNRGNEAITVAGQMFYIPSDGKYQSYIGRIPPGITIGPGETREIPVHGYCLDVHKPAVPLGEEMPPADTFIPVGTPSVPTTPGGPVTVPVLPGTPVNPFEPGMIPTIAESPGFKPKIPSSTPGPVITYPGTTIPVGGTFDPRKDPRTFAPIAARLVEVIETATTVIQRDPHHKTPFANDPQREREAIIQQTIWICTSTLKGEPYTKDDFAGRVYDQFRDNTGVAVANLPEEQKEQVDSGITDFWSTFMATGAEAKVLKEDAPGITISGPGDDTPPAEEDIPPPEEVATGCEATEEVKDTGPKLDYAIADTGTKKKNEEVLEAFKAAIEEAAGIISDAKKREDVDVEFSTPEMPASAWSIYFPHVVAGRANATAMAVDLQNPLESAWTTEPIKTKADGSRTVILTHALGDGCTSTMIGVNLAKVRASSGMDATLGNIEALKVLNFVGEVAIDIVVQKGKGTFKKLSKYLKEKTEDMAKDAAKEFIKEELKKLGKELEGKTEEEAEQTMEELLEQIKSGEEEPEDSEFLEDWLAEYLVEGDDFNPAEKIADDIIDNFDSPIDWAPIKTNTYALAEGSLDIWVQGNHDKAAAASGVRYKRKELEAEEEAVKGGGVYCKHARTSAVTSGKITLKTEGKTASFAGATGEGIISTGHGMATATLESFNGMFVIAICECPDGILYDTYSSTTGFSNDGIMTSVWNRVFENLMNEVVDQFGKDLEGMPQHQRRVSKEMVSKVQEGLENAAGRAAKTILPCEK